MTNRSRRYCTICLPRLGAAVLAICVFLAEVRAEDTCGVVLDDSITKMNSKEDMAASQIRGRQPDHSGKEFADGILSGGNSYTIISDGAGWPTDAAIPGQAALVAHPPSVTTNNPFSFELSWPMLDCVLRRNVGTLISDGTYNHFTVLWEVDRLRQRYSFADQHPDAFFLANKNNLLAIDAQPQKIRGGPIVHWIGKEDFQSVFVELFYPAKAADFIVLFNAAQNQEQKARIAYAAFLSFAVYSDDRDIGTSLAMARNVFDNLDRLDPKLRAHFPYELSAVLSIAKLMNGQTKSAGKIPKEVKIDDVPFVLYQSDKGPLNFDEALISDLSRRLGEVEPKHPFDYLHEAKIDLALRNVERLLTYRLIKTAVLYADNISAANLLNAAMEIYPDDPRLIMYTAVLELKTSGPKSSLSKLQDATSKLEKIMLEAARATNLESFRQAIIDYHPETDKAEVPYGAWWEVVAMTRRLADENGSMTAAREAAKKELFKLYVQQDDEQSFCKYASDYARLEVSESLKDIAASLKRSEWFGMTCVDSRTRRHHS